MDNIRPNYVETKISYPATAPKPRLVKLFIKPEARDSFTVGVSRSLQPDTLCTSNSVALQE